MYQQNNNGDIKHKVIQTPTLDINKNVLSDPEKAVKHGINAGYPLAVWRHPNETHVSAIVDIKSHVLQEVNELESCEAGFLINPFNDHHPSVPKYIRADLIFNWNQNNKDDAAHQVSPNLSASDLESFLSTTPTDNKNRNRPLETKYDTDFEKLVQRAVQEIKEGSFSKVVLSRYKEIGLPADFDLLSFFEKACEAYPNAFCYLAYTPQFGLWMGASPETLLSTDNTGQFETMSLAGTQRLDDRSLQDIAWTQKEIEEQAMVSRYIIDCFKKIRLREFSEIGPRTSRAGNLAHLKTSYKVDMKKVRMENLGSTMMHLLHPTSAVCGMPLMDALKFIKEHEQYDRELYAGFLGPVNIGDQSRLYVNLRCMKIEQGEKARLYAGAGITEDSDPTKEFLETEMKINTLKKLFDQ